MTERNGCSLAVVAFPDKCQIYDDWWSGLKNEYPVMLNKKWDRDAPTKRLSRILNELKIPFIDLVPVLREKALAMDRLYFTRDTHWNYLGNRVVAGILSERVTEYVK